MTKKKTGKQIYEETDSCFDRHCSSGYNMHDIEVPAYEEELALLNSQRWIQVDGLVAELTKQLEDSKVSILGMFAYQGPPSKRWIETKGQFWEGWNKGIDKAKEKVLVLLGVQTK